MVNEDADGRPGGEVAVENSTAFWWRRKGSLKLLRWHGEMTSVCLSLSYLAHLHPELLRHYSLAANDTSAFPVILQVVRWVRPSRHESTVI